MQLNGNREAIIAGLETGKIPNEFRAAIEQLLSCSERAETLAKLAIVVETDANGVITEVDDSFCQLSGYSREELIGQPHRITRHPDIPAQTFEKMWQTIKAGEIWHGQIKNLTKQGRLKLVNPNQVGHPNNPFRDDAEEESGDYYWVEATITPKNSTERIISYLAVRQDITAQKIAEEKANNLAKVLEDKVNERTLDLEEAIIEIINSLARAAELRDNETGKHVLRMSEYAAVLARGAGLDEAVIDLIRMTAPMHDVGKIGISDNILLKPSKLTLEEFKKMQTHTTIGHEILGGHTSEQLEMARTIACTHHEKWNGTGYPRGLVGDKIPLVGRIVAIADVFDALTTKRPYKAAWSVNDAITEIKKECGAHFDPEIVAIFLQNIDEILNLKEQFSDT